MGSLASRSRRRRLESSMQKIWVLWPSPAIYTWSANPGASCCLPIRGADVSDPSSFKCLETVPKAWANTFQGNSLESQPQTSIWFLLQVRILRSLRQGIPNTASSTWKNNGTIILSCFRGLDWVPRAKWEWSSVEAVGCLLVVSI